MLKFLRAAALLLWLSVLAVPLMVQAASDDKIIVSGASGQLGELTVDALLKRGLKPANLILVSRTPDKLAEYARLGASTRFGDLTQPESLPAAYRGGTRMLLISVGMGSMPRPQMHKNAIDAAVKAGVKHIVYTSFLGADKNNSPIAADHFQTEALLKASGVAWTFLRNGFYADMTVQQALQMASSGKATVSATDAQSAPVTREDCAAAAAGALTTAGHEYKAYDITGPELFGARDIARVTSEIIGKPIELVVQAGSAVGMPMMPPPGAAPSATPGAPAAMPPPPMMTGEPVVSDAVAKLSGRPGTGLKALLLASKDKLQAAAK